MWFGSLLVTDWSNSHRPMVLYQNRVSVTVPSIPTVQRMRRYTLSAAQLRGRPTAYVCTVANNSHRTISKLCDSVRKKRMEYYYLLLFSWSKVNTAGLDARAKSKRCIARCLARTRYVRNEAAWMCGTRMPHTWFDELCRYCFIRIWTSGRWSAVRPCDAGKNSIVYIVDVMFSLFFYIYVVFSRTEWAIKRRSFTQLKHFSITFVPILSLMHRRLHAQLHISISTWRAHSLVRDKRICCCCCHVGVHCSGW